MRNSFSEEVVYALHSARRLLGASDSLENHNAVYEPLIITRYEMKEIKPEWIPFIKTYTKEQFSEERDYLLAGDFQYNVMIAFDDGSFCCFKNAFYIFNEEGTKAAVFTEHCGYHYFSAVGTTFELLKVEDISSGRECI